MWSTTQARVSSLTDSLLPGKTTQNFKCPEELLKSLCTRRPLMLIASGKLRSKFFATVIFYCYFFFGHTAACGILAPGPGIKPRPPALEVQSLNPWTAREVPTTTFWMSINSRHCYAQVIYMSSPWNTWNKNNVSIYRGRIWAQRVYNYIAIKWSSLISILMMAYTFF